MRLRAKTDRRSYRVNDPIMISLTVSNFGMRPLRLEFPSAQYYDFFILSKGIVKWRWSTNKLFASVPHDVNLDPGEEFTVSELLRPGTLSGGTYTLVGVVTSIIPYRSWHRFLVLDHGFSRHSQPLLAVARRQSVAERAIEAV